MDGEAEETARRLEYLYEGHGHALERRAAALLRSQSARIADLESQVANWERKEIQLALCCVANEERVAELEGKLAVMNTKEMRAFAAQDEACGYSDAAAMLRSAADEIDAKDARIAELSAEVERLREAVLQWYRAAIAIGNPSPLAYVRTEAEIRLFEFAKTLPAKDGGR